MFYWLFELSNTVPGLGMFRTFLNVFRYTTFRTGGAIFTGALFVFLFGPWIIDHLRLRQGKGQPIRIDGPQSHLVTKIGTPTMGGLMILSGLVVSTLLWANTVNPYVWIVLAVTLGFGFVGFYDDYLKVTKQSHSGFAGKLRLSIEAVIVLAAIGGLFVLEAVSVIVQVASFKLTGKRVFRMAPLHHHFEQKGWTEPQIVIRFWIISVMLALAGLSTLKLR